MGLGMRRMLGAKWAGGGVEALLPSSPGPIVETRQRRGRPLEVPLGARPEEAPG